MLIYIQEPPHICLLLANKQWGSNFSTVSAVTLVNYPIAVNTVLTILCSADQTDIHDAEHAGPGTITNTNFKVATFALFGNTHVLPYPYYWIMIGIAQQWGYATTTVTLPLNFENTNYAVALTKADTSSGGAAEAWVAVTNKTVTNFTWRGQWTSHINWFAIGRQRIKRRRYHNRQHTTLFLQILLKHHKHQWHQN